MQGEVRRGDSQWPVVGQLIEAARRTPGLPLVVFRVCPYDGGMGVEYATPCWLEMVGRSLAQACAGDVAAWRKPTAGGAAALDLRMALRSGHPATGAWVYVRPDGGRVMVQSMGLPIWSGDIVYLCMTEAEITACRPIYRVAVRDLAGDVVGLN